MLKVISSVIGLGGLACFGLAIKVYLQPDEVIADRLIPNELPPEILSKSEFNLYTGNDITLSEASHFWVSNELDFRDIATLWREIEPPEPAKIPVRPNFTNEEIEAFYVEYVETQPVVKGKRRAIIVKLLKMLDSDGTCPSVVKKEHMKDPEPEGNLDDDVFKSLSRIPLWKHTLTVARKYTSKFSQLAMLPDTLIVSLAHDIGKIPSYHDKYYKTGEHSIISVHILNTIPEFKSLHNIDELERIIRGHHLLKTDFPLTEMLKHADQEARKDEHVAIMKAEMAGETLYPVATTVEQPSGEVDPSGKRVVAVQLPENRKKVRKKVDETIPEEKKANPFGDGDGSGQTVGKFVPSLIELPAWYESEKVLNEIAKVINILEFSNKTAKPAWSAITGGEAGVVWVSESGLWSALKKSGGKSDSEFLVSEADEGKKRNLIFSVVRDLGNKRKAISDMIGKTYYQIPVTIITGAGRAIQTFLVPFYEESFGVMSMDLETRKGAVLKRMVKAVKPKAEVQTDCVIL